MRVTPTSLTFTAVEGGDNPAAQSITMACDNPPATWCCQTHNEQLAPWVTETYPGTGNTFSYHIKTAGLAAGTYTTSMSIEMWLGANSSFGQVQGSPKTFPITLTITPKATLPPLPTSVQNPSFENWEAGEYPTGWSRYTNTTGTFLHADYWHKSGGYSLGMCGGQASANIDAFGTGVYQVVGGIASGKSYTASVWAATDRNPRYVRIYVMFLDASKKEMPGSTVAAMGDSWGLAGDQLRQMSVAGVAPVGATSAQLGVMVNCDGSVAFDDFTFNQTIVHVATRISRPTVSTSRPRRGKYATFSAVLSPGAAASGTSTKLLLYRQETKTVRKRVRGKMRRVKVKYWRLRSTIRMRAGASGATTGFNAKARLMYSGNWRAVASFGGSAGYVSRISSARAFTVR